PVVDRRGDRNGSQQRRLQRPGTFCKPAQDTRRLHGNPDLPVTRLPARRPGRNFHDRAHVAVDRDAYRRVPTELLPVRGRGYPVRPATILVTVVESERAASWTGLGRARVCASSDGDRVISQDVARLCRYVDPNSVDEQLHGPSHASPPAERDLYIPTTVNGDQSLDQFNDRAITGELQPDDLSTATAPTRWNHTIAGLKHRHDLTTKRARHDTTGVEVR